jgi:glycosyltransferase involved in cell wall biosynthesis
MKVTVVVPAYNEEGNILPTAEKVDACFRACSFRSELLLVDDGSTDETFAEMEEAANRYVGMRLLRHRRNRGLTEALKTGFANMTGDVAIFLPADLQYEPEEVIPTRRVRMLVGECWHRRPQTSHCSDYSAYPFVA